MPESKSREELIQNYRELQLRVTRFSAVEQELINARDRLDQELEMYKRLYYYNALALNAKSYEQFYHILCEAIVDVFEVEGAIIFLVNLNDEHAPVVYTEGVKIEGTIQAVSEAVERIHSSVGSDRGIKMTEELLSQNEYFSQFNQGLFGIVKEEKFGLKVYVMGLVSQSNARLYSLITERKETLFGVFMQQLQALVSNRKQTDQIEDQFNIIRKSEEELRKLSLIATKTKSGVIITDTFGRIEWVNEAFQNISGFQLDEVKGLKPKDFLQGANSEDEPRNKLKQALSKREDVEVTIVNYNKEGKPYYNNLEIISVFNEKAEHTHFIALQKDITNEILFKQELVRVNSRFELIANQSRIGIWEFDAIHLTVVWSDVLFEIYGMAPMVDNGNLNDIWKNAIHEDDREAVLASLEVLNEGQLDSVELEFRITRERDSALRIIKSLTVAEKNDQGKIIRLVGSAQDITELKNAQEVMASNNIELKKINSELDNFVYSISHDLRSPLLSIKGIISLIIHSDELDPNTIQLLEMADKSVARLDGTIQEILEYSRNSRLNVANEKFDVREMVTTIFDDLKFSNKDPFEVDLNFQGDAEIYSDKARVSILLKNIIGNSVKYGREGVVSHISFRMHSQNGKITMSVADNGQGISEANKDKIFNMFFRGTTASVGTGLGLYICKEIVAKLGGSISVDSQLGVGTTMTVVLPELNL
jgi:PAS domain S-box-containing protein